MERNPTVIPEQKAPTQVSTELDENYHKIEARCTKTRVDLDVDVNTLFKFMIRPHVPCHHVNCPYRHQYITHLLYLSYDLACSYHYFSHDLQYHHH